MNRFSGIALGFVVLVGVWRLASERTSLPCPVWLAWMVEMDNPFTKVNRAQSIIENLDVKTGMFVLDAGCGPGRLTVPLAKKVGPEGSVTALDIQDGMLLKVRQKAEVAGVHNIQFMNAGLGECKLEKAYYDRAVLVTVLGEIPNQQSAFDEIFEALKQNGVLAVTEIIFDPHFQTKTTVRKLARAAGFKEKTVFGGWYAYTMLLEKDIH